MAEKAQALAKVLETSCLPIFSGQKLPPGSPILLFIAVIELANPGQMHEGLVVIGLLIDIGGNIDKSTVEQIFPVLGMLVKIYPHGLLQVTGKLIMPAFAI